MKGGDEVKVNGQLLEPQDAEEFIFIALNKPVGIVSTTESSDKNNIVDFVNHSSRIFPIGRLDKDSQGLIFLTSNGDLVNKILRAGNNHEKEYLVTVNKPITDEFIAGLSNGVPMLGVTTKKCKVVKESTFVFNITLVQGLNRQIRRMCEYFNYEVTKLNRSRIMNISLKGLPVGDWRELQEDELKTLLDSIKHSSSETISTQKNNKQKNVASPKKSSPSKNSSSPTSRRNTKVKPTSHKNTTSQRFGKKKKSR